METMQIGPWNVEYDREKTRALHNAVESPKSEKCKCAHCRNFVVARDTIYPEQVRTVLEKLGVDYRKEQEVYQIHEIDPGWHLYNGWFRFVGAISDSDGKLGISDRTGFSTDDVPVNETFSWSLSQRASVVSWGLPVVEIHFEAKVPWMLKAEKTAF